MEYFPKLITIADPNRDTSGCLIATGSKDRTIRVWSRSHGKQLFMKKLPSLRREASDQGMRIKTWVAVHWLKSNPEQLVSSSSGYVVGMPALNKMLVCIVILCSLFNFYLISYAIHLFIFPPPWFSFILVFLLACLFFSY